MLLVLNPSSGQGVGEKEGIDFLCSCNDQSTAHTVQPMAATMRQMEPQGNDEYFNEEEYVEYEVEEEYYEYVEEVIEEEEYVEDTNDQNVQQQQQPQEPQEPQGGSMAAMIAAAASKRQGRLERKGGYPEPRPRKGGRRSSKGKNGKQSGSKAVVDNATPTTNDDDDVPQGGMAAMIAAAANKRNNRLDQGGEKKVTHVEKPPDEGLDMAAMIAKKANARNARVEAGGELQVREVRVIPKEHKNMFVDVAMEAARIGTLTRLNEHTVVAVAAPKVEEVWKGPSGLRTDHLRSAFFVAINEAAALGAMKRQKAHEVTNYDEKAYVEEEEPEDIDKMTDENGRRVVRQMYLIDRRLEEERKYKKEEWSAENAVNVVQYNSLDDVALPVATAPKWKPKKAAVSHKDLMEAISNGVAERAWERNYRLGRPKARLQVTRKCNCKFCVNPNPYQTHKYKQMEEKGIEKAEEAPKLEAKEEPKKITTEAWNGHVKQSRNVKPGDWTETSTFTPVPTAMPPKVPKNNVRRPHPEPIIEKPPEVSTTTETHQAAEQYNAEPVVTILLDETMTWGHKREKTPKPKKEKPEKEKTKSKTKKKAQATAKQEGCTIM